MTAPWTVVFLIVTTPLAFADRPLFPDWFPGFGDYFRDRLQNNCYPEYEAYLHNSTCVSCLPSLGAPLAVAGSDAVDGLAINVFSCLLDHSEEHVKANLAVGNVILGVLPTILSFSGSTTAEYGVLALKRPLLATILALSAPSIFPLRTLDFDDNPIVPLQAGRAPFEGTRAPSGKRLLFLGALEYAFAVAAAANMGTQVWALCVKSVSALGPSLRFWPLFWPLTSLFVYFLGALQISLCIQLTDGRTSLRQKITHEFTPCASHARQCPAVRVHSKFLRSLAAWLVSFFTICNIIFGTAAFSSQLFVPVADAVFVGLRFLASAMVARFIIMYELSGMSHSLGPWRQQ
ncbi:MAG: hypothetical protein Q9159_007252 [Coniocarpon cinnabarinum]